jgi:hypothetical protein
MDSLIVIYFTDQSPGLILTTEFFCFQVVVGGGRMKFNKTEMAVLAGQPGHR